MARRFFKLTDDIYIPNRWHLNEPTTPKGREINPWQFNKGCPATLSGRIRIPVSQRGKPLDYSTTPLAATPIIHGKIAELFTSTAPDEAELIPVEISRQREQYYLVNTLRIIKCIDDARCEEVKYWLPEYGQPEKVGTYHSVIGMRIDPARAGNAHIFRPWGWEVTLIVSEEIKQGLEQLGATGPEFTEV